MKIYLYNYSKERNLVSKGLYLKKTIELDGTLRNECSVINPVIEVQSTGLISSNYAYIVEFNRYYFIDEITSIRNNLWRLSLSVDVLMTYKNGIFEQRAIISRQENSFNSFLKDELLPLQLERTIYMSSGKLGAHNGTFKNCYTGKEEYCYALTVFSGIGNSYSPTSTGREIESPYNFAGVLSHSPYSTCTQIFAMTYKQVEAFMKEISNFDFPATIFGEKGDYVVSLKLFPYQLKRSNFPDTPIVINKREMKTVAYQIKPTETAGGADIVTESFLVDYFDLTSIKNIFREKEFLTFQPYSTFKLYLPFYGDAEIDLKLFFNNTTYNLIGIYLTIDLLSGEARYDIYPVRDNQSQIQKMVSNPYYSFNFYLGVDVPISYNREATRKNELILGSIKTAISAGTSIAGVPLNFESTLLNNSKPKGRFGKRATRKAELSATRGIVESTGNITSNFIDTVSQAMQYSPINNKTDGYLGYALSYFPVMMLDHPIVNEPTNYAKLYGRPSMKYEILGMLNGFTIVSNIHIENISTALSEELEEIETLLKEGVIL